MRGIRASYFETPFQKHEQPSQTNELWAHASLLGGEPPRLFKANQRPIAILQTEVEESTGRNGLLEGRRGLRGNIPLQSQK